MQGFIDGEGSFQCEMNFSNEKKIYPIINFSLQIKQSNHDVAILYAIKNFFNCGYLKPKYAAPARIVRGRGQGYPPPASRGRVSSK